jgi:hypothetical protein
MNPRLLRLVLAFLAGFVLLSFLPSLPGLIGGLDLTVSPDRLADGLLYAGLLLSLALLAVVIHRRRSRPVRAASRRPATGSRQAVVPARAGYPRVRVINQGQPSALQQKIRAGSRPGERIPSIARRHSLSVDAIRVALDREPSSPAARTGSSFRSRQASVPAAPRTKALPGRRNPYGALA